MQSVQQKYCTYKLIYKTKYRATLDSLICAWFYVDKQNHDTSPPKQQICM